MKSSFINSLLLCIALLLTACGGKTSNTETVVAEEVQAPFTLEDKGTKTFPLDFETSIGFSPAYRLRQFEGKEYLLFGNSKNRMIYEFEYESSQLSRKIKLATEGPNQVNLLFSLSFFFHTPDSIFINSNSNGYYLINGKGEVLLNSSKQGAPGFDVDCCPVSLGNGTYYQNNKLFGQQSFRINDDEESDLYEYASFDFGDGSTTRKLLPSSQFIASHQEILDMELDKDPWVANFSPSFSFNQNLLYATSPISDSVYVFEGLELVDRFYLSAPNTELPDHRSYMLLNKLIRSSKGNIKVSEIDQPPHFSGLFVSPDGNTIYRLLIEATKPRYIEDIEREMPEVSKASLVVYDMSTQQITTFNLPVDEIKVHPAFNNNLFVTNRGLHIETQEQENEDELVFRVFGPTG